MEAFSWTCPFCQRPVTITENDVTEQDLFLVKENKDGERALTSTFIICPNPKCKKMSLTVKLSTVFEDYGSLYPSELLNTWSLIPRSKAQSYPAYIPAAILEDYNEACLILDLSPKASATLARRCIQGIIRDYWQIKLKSDKLSDELDAIKDKVDVTTWDAIDAVRQVGNIGAHMEKDINLIIDVEPKEARLLVELIEILLKDWYIARHERQQHLKAVTKIAADKKVAKKARSSSVKAP